MFVFTHSYTIKYISLCANSGGLACSIAQAINNIIGKNETNFFDWIISSFESCNFSFSFNIWNFKISKLLFHVKTFDIFFNFIF